MSLTLIIGSCVIKTGSQIIIPVTRRVEGYKHFRLFKVLVHGFILMVGTEYNDCWAELIPKCTLPGTAPLIQDNFVIFFLF